jgi:hypothetical protein
MTPGLHGTVEPTELAAAAPDPLAASTTRLGDAHQQGAGGTALRGIVVEGLQKVYFNGNGVRAQAVEVDISDIDVSF